MEGAKQAEVVSKDYQFDKIKPDIERIIDTIVSEKCRNVQYDPRQGQQLSKEIVRKAQDLAGKNFKI